MARDSIFISYSQKDRKWLEEVKKHLSILEHEHQLEIWDDSRIKVGSDWKKEIEQSIKRCKAAVLLVSSHFLASSFILKKELPQILDASKQEGITILNLILDTCAFKLSVLEKYQCSNNPQFPLVELKAGERNLALVNLAYQLKELFVDKKSQPEGEKPDLDEEPNSFSSVIVLAFLIKTGGATITQIQETTTLNRKVIVSILEKFSSQGYIIKIKENHEKNKPSIRWKASTVGYNIFDQFEAIYTHVLNATTSGD